VVRDGLTGRVTPPGDAAALAAAIRTLADRPDRLMPGVPAGGGRACRAGSRRPGRGCAPRARRRGRHLTRAAALARAFAGAGHAVTLVSGGMPAALPRLDHRVGCGLGEGGDEAVAARGQALRRHGRAVGIEQRSAWPRAATASSPPSPRPHPTR
jgi:hypothetical protein